MSTRRHDPARRHGHARRYGHARRHDHARRYGHARRVRRASVAASALLIACAALAGCTATESTPTPSPTGSAGASPAPSPSDPSSAPSASPLRAVFPGEWNVGTAAAESTRIGDAIVDIIDPALIVNDDTFAQEVPASGENGGYYGVLHTLTLDPTADAGALAASVVAELGVAGWTPRDASDQGGTALVALVSGDDPGTSWLAIIGSDGSVAGQSVLSIQLASPDLPPAG